MSNAETHSWAWRVTVKSQNKVTENGLEIPLPPICTVMTCVNLTVRGCPDIWPNAILGFLEGVFG